MNTNLDKFIIINYDSKLKEGKVVIKLQRTWMVHKDDIKKYYLVFLENISSKKTNGLKEVVYSFAEEHRGVLTDLLTGKVIYCSEKFDVNQFKEANASLYGFKKMETTREQTRKALSFLSTEYVYQYSEAISLLEQLTKEEVKRRYDSELESLRDFAANFGVNFDDVKQPRVIPYQEYLEKERKGK